MRARIKRWATNVALLAPVAGLTYLVGHHAGWYKITATQQYVPSDTWLAIDLGLVVVGIIGALLVQNRRYAAEVTNLRGRERERIDEMQAATEQAIANLRARDELSAHAWNQIIHPK